MSLIHDSLRKLENNQSKPEGLDSSYDDYETSSGSNAKKLWILGVVVVGIVLIVYAYMMLERYQKQNEMLLNDMKQLKTGQLIATNTTESQTLPYETTERLSSNNNNDIKPIIQTPIQVPIKEVTASIVNVTEKSKVQTMPSIDSSYQEKSDAEFLLEKAKLKQENQLKMESQKKAVVPTYKPPKKKKAKKLTIKQTRLLVNNLQIQIDSENNVEVEKLLNQLAQSSGENSIVYLRMKAYWSTKTKDDNTAATMYKKILFQNPQDIQANTNLALLEARNGNAEQAIARLKALSLEYPTNKSIVTYLSRVENMHDL